MLYDVHMRRRTLLFRTTALVAISSIALTSIASPIAAATFSIANLIKKLQQQQNAITAEYTESPTEVYVGSNPLRDPTHRGGLWTDAQIQEVQGPEMSQMSASAVPMAAQVLHHPICLTSGTSEPWEGSQPAVGGSVNTQNGNKTTAINLFSWKQRGGLPIDFTLYHNSQYNYDLELGHNWSHSYNIYLSSTISTTTVHWGDGTCIPYGNPDYGDGGLWASVEGAVAYYPDTTFTAPAGIHDVLVHKTSGAWTLTKPDQTVYNFNSSSNITSIVDRNGNTATISYNTDGFVNGVTDATGRTISITLNTSDKITAVADAAGHSWSFSLNGSDELATVTWPTLGGTGYTDQFTYDGTSYAMLTHVDRRGKTWTWTYGTGGVLASQTDPLSHTTTWGYTSSATTETNPLSGTNVDNYSSGKLASKVDPSSFSESYTYNSDNQVLTRTDQRGKVWTYTRDSMGNVLTSKDPLNHTTTYAYNSFSEPLTVTDPLTHVTATNTYDTHGNLLTVTDGLSHTVRTNTYNTNGTMATSSDALSHSTSFSYGTNGDLTSITDPLSHATTMAYDTMGRLTSSTDALSHTESVAYDVWERPITWTHPDSTAINKTYDTTGNVTAITDENSHSSYLAYDNAGRQTSYTNGVGDVESYSYDANNRRTSVTNGRSKTRNYTFTARGEIHTLTMPDSAVETWSYDGNGDVTAYTNPLSQSITHSFDDASRKTGISYPTGTGVTFNYDSANRRTSLVDSTGTSSWTYDNADRVTALSTPEGNMSYSLDNSGRRTGMTESIGSTSYSYDNANRMTSLTNPYSETTSWTYDNANRVTNQTFANGTYTSTSYDSRNRPTAITHYQSGGTVTISTESYSYDSANNPSSKTVDGTTTNYTYDSADQLLSESYTGYSASYTYDANGNRLTKTLNGTTDTYTYDDGDKMTAAGAKAYTYDAAGRTTSVTVGAATTTLSYDYENRVTSITFPSSATNSFTYNGLDTRVGKVDSSGTFTYKRDGVTVTDPVLNDAAAEYTSGISERRGTSSKFYHSDRLGSSTKITDSGASTTDSRAYDAFGLTLSSSGSTPTPFGFVGKGGYLEDADSGLKLLGHRYYDPSTGRFLTRDSACQGRNWYCYSDNNPQARIDTDGAGWRAVVGGIAGGILGGIITFGNPIGIAAGASIFAGLGDASDQASQGEDIDWGHAGTTGLVTGVFSLIGGWMLNSFAEAVAASGTGSIGTGAIGSGVGSTGGVLTPVTRYGSGLENGNWVMMGRPNFFGYIASGKWQPGGTNTFAPPSNAWVYYLEGKDLRWPTGVDAWKGIIGQRIYKP
jgi:RHS repeat-associated protein